MKRLISLFLVVLISLIAYSFLNKEKIQSKLNEWISKEIELNEIDLPESEPIDYKFDYYSNSEKGIYAAKFNISEVNFDYITQKDLSKTTDELNESENTSLIINAGYFYPEYGHIGLLSEDGQLINNLSYNNPQVDSVIEFKGDLMNLFVANDYTVDNSANLAFQTGPAVIKDDVIQTQQINNSLNGNGTYLRSVIGYSSEGYGFILASINTISLTNLAEIILSEDEFFSGEITAVNLDGGTSVSFASSENEEFGFRREKRLPYYLRILNNK